MRKAMFRRAITMLLLAVPALAGAAAGASAPDVSQSAWRAAPAPPMPGDPSDNRRLASLIAELERHNPEIKAARREIDMRVARIGPAGAPPDPTLSVGYMGGLARPFFPAGTSGGFQQFAASQELPFPGKLALRTRVASAEADIARWDYEETRVELASALKRAYFDYVQVDRTIAIARRHKELLEQFARIAEAQFAVGRGLQQDVLKAHLEISLLLERIAMLESRRIAAAAEINALLYRASDAPVDASLAFEAAPELPGVDELRRLAAERSPMVKSAEQTIARGQQQLALARREVLPDFAVNVISQRPAADMPWMYGVDVMVKVPLFAQRKQRPMIAEAAAALEAGRNIRDAALAEAAARVTDAHAMAATSRTLVTLYQDSVLPQARLALESSVAAYQVGSVDFLTLLTNFATVLGYEINLEEQQAAYHRALARLEPLVGLELIK
jgi:cobalt-zinc-cadmium efflux system outer membrane protein